MRLNNIVVGISLSVLGFVIGALIFLEFAELYAKL